MTQPTLIGIDIGTSSIKVVAIDFNGEVLAVINRPISLDVPRPGWSEQNPEDWWSATCVAIRQLLVNIEMPEVFGIGLSGQMHSLVALDANQQVLRPAILWNDVRTKVEANSIREIVGDDALRRFTGNPSLEGFTATKLMWMRSNEPELFDRLTHVLMPKDYIRFRLTDEIASDPSDASGTLLFDVAQSCWSDEMLLSLAIDSELLPTIVESSEIVGSVTRQAADQTGLKEGIPVITGGADNAMAAVGGGVHSPGGLLISLGTSGTVVAPTKSAEADPEMRIHVMRHVIPDTWYLMGVVLSAGAALDWWRRISGCADFDQLVREAGPAKVGSGGVTFLPYLTGERTPHADANARGVFFGIHSGTERAHMTRAVMEGVSFALNDSLQLIENFDVNISEAIAVGGGVNSSMWLQMLSDVMNLPLHTLVPSEGAPLGAAMLASVGTGIFDNVSDVAGAWLTNFSIVTPEVSLQQAYDDAYGRYRSLYPALEKIFSDQTFHATSSR